MPDTYDVVIVGGGTILLLDSSGPAGQGWRAAAGMLAPQVEAQADDILFRLALASRDGYAPLAAALHERTGTDIGLWQGGILRLAWSAADANELRRRVAWQRAAGQPAEWLVRSEVRARWPWLGESYGALWAPRDGMVEPERLVQALRLDACRSGAVVVEDTVLSIERRGARAVGVIGRAGRYGGGAVVLTAGAWSGRMLGLLRPVPVEPVRGQMVAFPRPTGLPTTVVMGSNAYLLARPVVRDGPWPPRDPARGNHRGRDRAAAGRRAGAI